MKGTRFVGTEYHVKDLGSYPVHHGNRKISSRDRKDVSTDPGEERMKQNKIS